MKSWEHRPQEVANLLNPAFCAGVLYRSMEGYAKEHGRNMPYALGFLVLPLILHPDTRATIQGTTRHFQVWINNHQHIKLGLCTRARTLVPFAREALGFLCTAGVVEVQEDDASLAVRGSLRRRRNAQSSSADVRECSAKAAILGKWLSRVNSAATVYVSLGLIP